MMDMGIKNLINSFIKPHRRHVNDVTVINHFGIGTDQRAERTTVYMKNIKKRNDKMEYIRKPKRISGSFKTVLEPPFCDGG